MMHKRKVEVVTKLINQLDTNSTNADEECQNVASVLIDLIASDCFGIISRRLTIQRLAEFAFNPERGFEHSRLAAQTVLERLFQKLNDKKKASHSI